jgi:uncharacterized FlaG/YvyC family protein
MIEPILKIEESDIAKYNEFFAQSKKQSSKESQHFYKQVSAQIADLAKQEDIRRDKLKIVDTFTGSDNNANNQATEQFSKKKSRINFTEMANKLIEITGMKEVYFQFLPTKSSKNGLIMKVIDKSTDEVIQQFPSEISMRIAKMIEENYVRGQITNATV